MLFASILAICTFMLSLLGTRLLILVLRKRPVLIDVPNARSNHRAPTPKGGGLAVVMSLIIALSIAGINYAILLPVLLLMAVSLMDDVIGVPVFVRFGVQVAAVGIALIAMPSLSTNGFIPDWAIKMLIGVVWLWFINLFNFMDGIDGLSATEMICIGFGLCLPLIWLGHFSEPLALQSLLVAMAACGFIWWNWHPAKIFLGDVGSIPLGFILGYLLIAAATQGYLYSALILPAYYISDTTVTLIKRLRRGQKPWVAHSDHYYQQAVRGGRSHDSVVRVIFGTNMFLIMLATLCVIFPAMAPLYLGIAYGIVFLTIRSFIEKSPPYHAAS